MTATPKSNTALTVLIDLPFLAREINDAHAQVQFHAKSLLLEAKRAGEALIEAKKQCRHGEFKAWVEAHCRCSYRRAAQYMAWAKSEVDCTFPGAWEEWQRISGNAPKTKPAPTPAAPAFTQADAEYALKLKAMADRGGTPNEREVAAKKLESFAQGFGLTADATAEKAVAMQPEEVNPFDELERLRAELERRKQIAAELHKRFETIPKEKVIDILADLKARGVWKEEDYNV